MKINQLFKLAKPTVVSGFIVALTLTLAGCGTAQEKPAQERAWLGGDYRPAKKIPKEIAGCPKGTLWVTGIRTNTPASAAGLEKGDLILEVNHQPISGLSEFRRRVDESGPGTTVPITAFRDGRTNDYNVVLGREKFRDGGNFAIIAPCVARGWQFWPSNGRSGFSLVALGYETEPDIRPDLSVDKKKYAEGFPVSTNSYHQRFEIWLGPFWLTKGDRILSQEKVEPRNGG